MSGAVNPISMDDGDTINQLVETVNGLVEENKRKDEQIQELEEGWERYQILREVVASSTNMDEDELDQLVEQRRTEDGE